MRRLLVGLLLAGLLLPVHVSAGPCNAQHPCPTPGPVMARMWFGGYETRSNNMEGSLVSGAPALETVNVRSGSAAMGTSGATNQGISWQFTGVLSTTYFARSYIYITALPNAAAIRDLIYFSGGGTPQATISLTDTGALRLAYNQTGGGGGGTQVGSVSAALSLNTWYRVELALRIGTGTIDTIEGQVDGVSFASGSSLAISETAPSIVTVGMTGFAADAAAIVFDDWALDDASFPGDGKVILLLPTADNARGTGWVGGAGGTTNLFNAVDNTPPVGVADTGTDTSQIRNATAAANTNYDATMTTYTAAGIAAADTVNFVMPLVSTAAPISTGAKQGTVGVASNPTIANVALSATGVSGAFWQGNAAGTFPTGWKRSQGTVAAAPSVTVGTAPVMRITQVTSSTRIADVCFMGMYVDYTPGVAERVVKVSQYPQLLAH